MAMFITPGIAHDLVNEEYSPQPTRADVTPFRGRSA